MAWFFFSYASDNRHRLLDKFFEELKDTVAQSLAPPDNADAAFADWKNLQLMDSWNSRLQEALEKTRILVCITSPAYIVKEFCGKEVALFDHQRHQRALEVILPIIWTKTAKLPKILADGQFDRNLPPEYKTLGLFTIMNLGKWGAYKKCLNAFAEAIIEKGQLHPPRPPIQGVTFENIQSAFTQRLRANFLFLAANRQDFAGDPREHSYSFARSYHWRPFHPPEPASAGEMAELATAKHQIGFDVIPPDAQALASIRKAKQRNEPVVIVADPWTMERSSYCNPIAGLDPVIDSHTALIVPWNEQEPAFAAKRSDLEKAVHDAIEGRTPIYGSPIKSAKEFENELDKTIAALKQAAIGQGAEKKPVSDSMVTVAGPGK